jgi:hypothetical protein
VSTPAALRSAAEEDKSWCTAAREFFTSPMEVASAAAREDFFADADRKTLRQAQC